MRSVCFGIALLSLRVLVFAQTNQKHKPAPSPTGAQPQVLELQLTRDTQPLVLFDRAVKDAEGRCRVHHRQLEAATVPIIYGLMPGRGSDYYEAEKRDFPNAVTSYEAGCEVMPPQEAKVLQCRKCLEAKREWAKKRSAS